MDKPSNFLNALFDFSFSEFITIKIIKVLYGIGVAGAAIGALMFIIKGFSASAGQGILFLILSPIIFFLYVVLARVWLEIVIVLFRIAENVGEIADAKK